jgi:hypothetical protein
MPTEFAVFLLLSQISKHLTLLLTSLIWTVMMLSTGGQQRGVYPPLTMMGGRQKGG